MDYFLIDRNCVDRLFGEWEKHGSLIVAYDFDNTVFDYHNSGLNFYDVIKLLRECKQLGFHLVVFTSSNDDKFPEIERYLRENNIPFDGINETPDFIPFKGRKIYFNILLDDRAGLSTAYNQLWNVVNKIKSKLNHPTSPQQ